MCMLPACVGKITDFQGIVPQQNNCQVSFESTYPEVICEDVVDESQSATDYSCVSDLESDNPTGYGLLITNL